MSVPEYKSKLKTILRQKMHIHLTENHIRIVVQVETDHEVTKHHN